MGSTGIITIADLIPVGRENAISRKSLIILCEQNGLIDSKIKDKDRAMRLLIKKARHDYVIINLSDGHGYYRTTPKDLMYLQRHIRQERNRIAESCKGLKLEERVYEDYKSGRIT